MSKKPTNSEIYTDEYIEGMFDHLTDDELLSEVQLLSDEVEDEWTYLNNLGADYELPKGPK